MNRLYAVAMGLLIASQPLFAEKGEWGPRKGKGGQHMERMIQKLQLSDEQATSFRQIMQEQREKQRAVMKELREEAKPQMEIIQNETIQRLSSVLDESQLQQYQELAAERRSRIQGRMQKRSGFN